MSSSFSDKASLWIFRLLSRPGMDEDTFTQKKINWISSIAVTSMIFLVTMVYHIIFPELKILIYYGLFLTAVYSQGIILPLIVRYTGPWRIFVDQSLAVIVTFVCILLLGGIPTSGGLIFVGLAQVFFSLNFREKRASLAIFIIYIVTVVLSGLLHPMLRVPEEMTPPVNVSLYVVNILWISGFAMVFIMNFISQRVRLEQMETTRVREMDEARNRLYTNITHEFRTPLTVISGMTDLMRKDPDRWVPEGCDKIDSNSRLLLSLVNNLLDLSKLEEGVMPVRMIRGDINQYIRYIVELFSSVAVSNGVALNLTVSSPGMIIDYDDDKLLHILSNLISNALKFTPPGGTIDVSTVMADDGSFEITVADTGQGIPEEFLPHVFERFSRAESGREFGNPGYGLGLALVRELVRLLKGTVRVDSTLGSGTVFTVSLPVTCLSDQKASTDLQDLRNRISGYIISHTPWLKGDHQNGQPHVEKNILLVVEDNEDVTGYLTAMLDGEYDVIVASDGEQGLSKAIELIPDIVLSDIMMPRMDGIEMLRRLKGDLRTSHIPVVILTARADISSRIEGLERGADAYISKPFDREELRAQLRSLTQQRKRLQERYASASHPFPDDDITFSYEDRFMGKVRGVLLSNLSNEQFDIQTLCHELALSRTQLYRKFRSLTNMSVGEYFKVLRLQKARELLLHGSVTVSEAAYRTGFKNVSHFSRVFTSQFGVNPSTFSVR